VQDDAMKPKRDGGIIEKTCLRACARLRTMPRAVSYVVIAIE